MFLQHWVYGESEMGTPDGAHRPSKRHTSTLDLLPPPTPRFIRCVEEQHRPGVLGEGYRVILVGGQCTDIQ